MKFVNAFGAVALAGTFGALALGLGLAACSNATPSGDGAQQGSAEHDVLSFFQAAATGDTAASIRCVELNTYHRRYGDFSEFSVYTDSPADYVLELGAHRNFIISVDGDSVLSVQADNAGFGDLGKVYGEGIALYTADPTEWACFDDVNGEQTSVARETRLNQQRQP